MRTVADDALAGLTPEESLLAKTAMKSRIEYIQKERRLLQAGGFQAKNLYRIEVALAANMFVNLAYNRDNPDIDNTVKAVNVFMELLSLICDDMIRGIEAKLPPEKQSRCQCNMCKLRRMVESGLFSAEDAAGLEPLARAADEEGQIKHLTEEDLKNATSNPDESSPWRQGMAHSEQVLERALSVPGGQTDPGAADGEGTGS